MCEVYCMLSDEFGRMMGASVNSHDPADALLYCTSTLV